MRKSNRRTGIALSCLVGLCLAPGAAQAATVVNGGFESGDFTGWTVQDEAGSAGTWSVYSGTIGPISRRPVPAPPEGTKAAVTDQNAPSSHRLYQDIALEPGLGHELSFDNNDYTGFAIPTPNSLSRDSAPNQQYRVSGTR